MAQYCMKCGAENADSALFCVGCGSLMQAAKDAAAAPPAPTGEQNGYYPPPPSYGQQADPYQQPAYGQQTDSYQQPAYGQQAAPESNPYTPIPPATKQKPSEQVPGFGAYLGWIIVMNLPLLIGLIFSIVWACSKTNRNRKNLAIALLLLRAVSLVLLFAVMGTWFAALSQLMDELGGIDGLEDFYSDFYNEFGLTHAYEDSYHDTAPPNRMFAY